MKRIIPFLNYRYIAFTISLLVIIGGISFTLLQNGFNWGMDFRGGFSTQVRIAPVALKVTNISEDKELSLEISKGFAKYTVFGQEPITINFKETDTIQNLIDFLSTADFFKIELKAKANLETRIIFNEKNDHLKPGESLVLQYPAEKAGGPFVSLEKLRQILSSLTGPSLSIQQIGEPSKQQFLIRVSELDLPKNSSGQIDSEAFSKTLIANLEKEFGENTVLLQSKQSLSAHAAQAYAVGSVIAIITALGCMLLYVTIRFRFNYAAAAVVALFHDVLTTIAFVGLFQVEINTAVVAALLTIIGFSINDTIVIYDRIRENEKLLKGQNLYSIINVSLSQTLARTFITSLVVFLAIFPLYIFGGGPVKDFSFTMIFGILTGTYSSIFIASPIVLIWQNAFERAKQRKEGNLYSSKARSITINQPKEVETTYNESLNRATSFAEQDKTSGPIIRVQRVIEKKKKKKH